jgi:hypothetical protein
MTSHPVEASAFTMEAITEALSKSIAEVLEELALDAMVAEVNPQRAGMMECHHDQQEKKSSRRNKSTMRVRHFLPSDRASHRNNGLTN